MTRRLCASILVGAAAVSMTVAAPAQADPGPADFEVPIILCPALGGPESVGVVRVRELSDGSTRLRVIVFSGGPADAVLTAVPRDFSGPGLPGELVLDGGGGGKLDLRGTFVEGDDPALTLLLDGMPAASTDPDGEC